MTLSVSLGCLYKPVDDSFKFLLLDCGFLCEGLGSDSVQMMCIYARLIMVPLSAPLTESNSS